MQVGHGDNSKLLAKNNVKKEKNKDEPSARENTSGNARRR